MGTARPWIGGPLSLVQPVGTAREIQLDLVFPSKGRAQGPPSARLLCDEEGCERHFRDAHRLYTEMGAVMRGGEKTEALAVHGSLRPLPSPIQASVRPESYVTWSGSLFARWRSPC